MNADNSNISTNPDLLWSVDTLAARLDDPNLRIIDVRPGERFAMGHIDGASPGGFMGADAVDETAYSRIRATAD